MFEDSLLESGGQDSKLHRRGPWATVASFIIQAALVGVLILIPLLSTETLPRQQLMGYLVAPPPPPPPPPPPAAASAVPKAVEKPHVTEIDNGQLKAPTKIPEKIAMIKEEAPPPPSSGGVEGGVVGGVPGGQAGGVVGGVLGSIVTQAPIAMPKAVVPAPPQRVKVSGGVVAGLLLNKVQPSYPPLAKQARIQGTVVLQAVIGKDGSIQHLKALSGHPMLIQSAIDAVSRWKYKPYILDGEPVEVDTQVTVNFTLAGG
jgi:periplasmic protein TonB